MYCWLVAPAHAVAGQAYKGVWNLPPTRPHCCGHSPLPSSWQATHGCMGQLSPEERASLLWSFASLERSPGRTWMAAFYRCEGEAGDRGRGGEAGWGGRGTGRPDGNGWRPTSSPSLGLRKGAKGEGMCRDRRGGGEGGAARGGVGTGWQPSSGVREIDLGGRSRG